MDREMVNSLMSERTDSLASALDTMAKLAPQVEADHVAYQFANMTERDAEAAVLERAIEIVKPALRALSSRIASGERTWWPDSVSTDTKTEYLPVRGFCLSGKPGPAFDHPHANDGAYEGSDLFLMTDGRLVVLTYSGTWSRWQGSSDEWTAAESVVTPAEALKTWDLSDILTVIVSALAAQAGGQKPRRTKAAIARAEKLQAILSLVGGAR